MYKEKKEKKRKGKNLIKKIFVYPLYQNYRYKTFWSHFHVVSLYPHLPHDEGLQTIHKLLENQADKSALSESLRMLAEIVLKENYFEINGKRFHQKLGTAFGTKFAPLNANLFMAGFEEKVFD